MVINKHAPERSAHDPDPEDVAAMISDTSRWEELAGCHFPDTRSGTGWGRNKLDDSPPTMRRLHLEAVRQRLLKAAGALKIESVPVLTYAELRKVRNDMRKYRWMFE